MALDKIRPTLQYPDVGKRVPNPMQATIAVQGRETLVYDRCELETMFLPVRQMLQLDRVTAIAGERLIAELDVANHWVFPMHFPDDPIFPGTLLIEAAGQAIAVWAWHAGFRGRPRLGRVSARYFSPVVPQDRTVTMVATVRQRKHVFPGQVAMFVQGRKVAEIEPVVFLLTPSLFGLAQPPLDG